MTELDLSSQTLREYLGSAAASGGPFSILGVGHDVHDQSMILRACQARLAQINGHRRSQTQAADDVRMAVLSAASQLLDPELRADLAEQWPERVDDRGVVGESPSAWRVDTSQQLDPRVVQQALTLVGACGGWNARARKRLGQFARLNAVSASQLVGEIIRGSAPSDSASHGVYGRANVGNKTGYQDIHGPSLTDPRDEALPWVVIPAAYLAMAVVIVSAGYFGGASKLLQSESAEVKSQQPTGGSRTSSSGNDATDSNRIGTRRHYSAIVYELEKYAREGIVDLENAAEFSVLGGRLIQQWAEFPDSELDRAVEAVRSVLAGLLSPEMFTACSKFIEPVDDESNVPILALGFREWFTGSQDLELTYSRMLDRQDMINADGAFDSAILRAFGSTAAKAVDDLEWWSWWIEQLEPMGERAGGQRDLILLSAIYEQLIDPDMGSSWDRCVQKIVQAVPWGPGSVTRSWMLGVIVDQRVQGDRLAVFTRGMVLYSSAQGLSMDLILDGDESMSEREAYLAVLRNRWASESSDGSDIRSAIIERMEELLQITRLTTGKDQAMVRSMELARVNSAYWLRSRGDEAGALLLMEGLGSDPNSSKSGLSAVAQKLELSSSDRDEQWATDARNLESQDELAAHLRRVGQIGPKSAHALVYLAMSAPNLSIRADAERVIMLNPDQPAILIALDRIVGSDRTTRRMVELANAYVGFDGSSIDAQASRESILERLALIGVLDDGSGGQDVQRYEVMMKTAYTSRSDSPDPHDPDNLAGAVGAYQSIVLDRLRNGERVPADIRAQLMVGLHNSGGPMQRFAVYQTAILEMHTIQLLLEQPGLKNRIQSILESSRFRQQRARTVFEQILILERTMTELFLIEIQLETIS